MSTRINDDAPIVVAQGMRESKALARIGCLGRFSSVHVFNRGPGAKFEVNVALRRVSVRAPRAEVASALTFEYSW